MMHTYVHARWRNAPAGCPLEMFSELDHARRETRKVEAFAGGRIYRAGPDDCSLSDTRLSDEPLPSLTQINSNIEFEAREIIAEEFEAVWARALG